MSLRKLLTGTAVPLLLTLLAGVAAGQTPAPTQAQPGMPSGQVGATYVNNTACKTCHEAEYDGLGTSPHAKIALSKLGERQQPGCQSCHGPGSKHVDNPGDTTNLFDFRGAKPAVINARCLNCHTTGAEQQHFAASVHAENGIACTDCHSVHHPVVAQALLKLAQPNLCYTCHASERAQFNMPSHHKVGEGLIQCTDCHDPHGAVEPHMVRTSAAADKVCFTCHVDKRGPFVYPHEAVAVDGCMSCHNPHGSSNPHLLKVADVNILCLQCHTASSFSGAPGIPSFHNQNSQFQACLNCHTQVHGSNFSPYFFY